MYAKCNDNDSGMKYQLTVGKIYPVLELDVDSITVLSDKNEKWCVSAVRFHIFNNGTDLVKCVDASDAMALDIGLTSDWLYEVKHRDKDMIHIINDDGQYFGYKADRFEDVHTGQVARFIGC